MRAARRAADRRRWLPLRRGAGHDVLELLQRGAAPRAAHFNLRGGDRYQHHDVGHRGGGLGERLRERELGVEVPAGEAFSAAVDGAVAQLAGVGDPFVDEHHRRAELLEQRRESRAGAGAGDVVGGHGVVALFAAELVSETTPQGVHHDVVADRLRCRWRDLLAHQHRSVDLSGQGDLRLGQHIGQPRQLGGVGARGQVVQRDQRVGLAATEVGLQLDHRVPALACQPFGRSREQVAQPLGDVGARKELMRVLVFGLGAAVGDEVQISRILGLHEVPAGHVLVWCDEFAPRFEPRPWSALGCLRSGAATLAARLLLKYLAELIDNYNPPPSPPTARPPTASQPATPPPSPPTANEPTTNRRAHRTR